MADGYSATFFCLNILLSNYFNDLFPSFRKRLRYVYLDHLKRLHDLKKDPIHRKAMKTKRKFMEEEDFDFKEATEAKL